MNQAMQVIVQADVSAITAQVTTNTTDITSLKSSRTTDEANIAANTAAIALLGSSYKPLTRWFTPKNQPHGNPLLGKKICLVMDSRGQPSSALYTYLARMQAPGGPLEGTIQTQWLFHSAGSSPTGGSITVTFWLPGGNQTLVINQSDSAATVQAAAQALTGIGAGNLLVTGSFPASDVSGQTGGFQFQWAGTLAEVPQQMITLSNNTLTPGGSTVTMYGAYPAGHSGMTASLASGWITGNSGHIWEPPAVAAIAPDVIFYSLDINDVRLGLTSEAQLYADHVGNLNWFLTNVPGADVVLFSQGSTIDGSNGYVSSGTPTNHGTIGVDCPSGGTQQQANANYYGDIMRSAIRRAAASFPQYYFWDAQALLFPDFYLPIADNGLMNDELHPSGTAAIWFIDSWSKFLGWGMQAKPGLADATRRVSSADYIADYTKIGREALKDTSHYDLLFKGFLGNSILTLGAISLDVSADLTEPIMTANMRRQEWEMRTDILALGNQIWAPGVSSSTLGLIQSGNNARFNSVPASGAGSTGFTPTYQGDIRIYRHKYCGDPNVEAYWMDRITYPYRWKGVVVAVNNGVSLDIGGMPGEILAKFRTAVVVADTLIVQGVSPQILTGITIAANGNNLRISWSGALTAMLNKPCAIFGAHAYEDSTLQRRVSQELPWMQVN